MGLLTKKIFLVAIATCAVFALGFLFGRRTDSVASIPEQHTAVREVRQEYRFIQPLLAVGDNPLLRQLQPLRDAVQIVIDQQKQSGAADEAAVYFRDFQSSQWMGIHEEDTFALASMYKVVLMIAVLKQAEADPSFFRLSVVYNGDQPLQYGNESNTSPTPIEKGKKYTIEDLIKRMIVYSDNNAKDLLFQVVDQTVLRNTFADLGVTMPAKDDAGDTISAKAYSIFFRVLYNASYLSRAVSEDALLLLSKTVFSDGLVAGVPSSVVVSHKFGHRDMPDGKTHELHDCGIVYYPEHPYFLCVMTRGKSDKGLQETIQKISQAVFTARQTALAQ